MRYALPLLLLFLCAAGAAQAEERNKRSRYLQRIIDAVDKNDHATLRKIAERDSPDPWLTADDLALWGKHDAALRFATAAPRPDIARLPAYLATRRTRAANTKLRAAVKRAEDAETEEAKRAALKALDEVLHQGDALERVLVNANRGNILRHFDRKMEAVETWLEAARIAERMGWLSMAAETFYVAGITVHAEMQYDVLMRAWQGLLLVEQARGHEWGAARATMFVGGVHLETGNYARALRTFQESRRMFAAIGSEDGVAWVLNNLALAHARCGEYHKEQAALELSLKLATKVGNHYRIACVKVDLGTVREHFGDFARAETLYHEAMDWFAGEDDVSGVAQCQGNLGHLAIRRKDWDKAVVWARKALASARKIEDNVFICGSLNLLGWALMHKGDLKQALALEQEAVDLARSKRDAWNEAHALQSLAEVLIRMKKHAQAETTLSESLRVAVQLESSELQMLGHKGQARLWSEMGDHARAVQASHLALEHSLRQLSGLPERQSATARARLLDLYALATRAAARLGKPQALFTTMESTRAGGLLEALENREAIRTASIPEKLLEQERVARNASLVAVHRYQKAVASGKWRARRKARAVLMRSREALDRSIEEIQAEAKSAAEMLYPEPPTMGEAQEHLAAHEAFVLYSLLGDEALALVVMQDRARIVKLGPPEVIREAASHSFDKPDRDPDDAIRTLRKLLLDPLPLGKRTKRLLISPDGVLGYVPFALLTRTRDVAYLPSIASYQVLRDSRTAPGKGVLALGDPDYRWKTEKTVQPATIAQRGGMRLVPLPATREEANLVGDVVLLGKRATPCRFFETLGTRERWAAVHLACHGLVDVDRPMRSSLALAFEPNGNNLLVCADVFQRQIPADLAVLSACETGKGKIVSGEGIVGLTRAFMLAGAPRVLVSLWKVDDEATQALMVEFYKRWRPKKGSRKRGADASTALRQAQEHVRRQKKWEHPYYWAAWVLWGLPD